MTAVVVVEPVGMLDSEEYVELCDTSENDNKEQDEKESEKEQFLATEFHRIGLYKASASGFLAIQGATSAGFVSITSPPPDQA